MNNSKFIGFLIVGTKTQEDALLGKGLILWMQKKPTFFIRFCNKLLLGIRWVDKEDYDNAKPILGVNAKFKEEDLTFKVEMPKQKVYKKKTDGAVKERGNTRISSTINKKQE
jgi:hypothetical protein